ncbi:MAG: 16S rRNA (guanine(966)-N(2))-methyltransferase RsmD [Proteobacteria bacterium]|nr:16S rRNA (guanine(966)-N(2))-methyltransferase RsmD [Pseudomonadota bacterium]
MQRGKTLAAAQKKPLVTRNSVRIIAGRWRGRLLRFPTVLELRPTPDRVRETLFNWLQRPVVDARCLDLCAGSGALGFEALSRGAAEVVLVERDVAVARALRASAALLGSPQALIVVADARGYLQGLPRPFDVVFLDPPFASGLLPELCTLLEQRGWLAPRAYVYLENAVSDAVVPLPDGWEAVRETRAGEVRGVLAQRRGTADPAAGGERTDGR